MKKTDFYESDRALGEYLLFHYGDPEEVLPWPDGPMSALDYPVRCVTECLEPDRLPENARALELGCAVGRSAFELARHCAQVVGLDASKQFIAAASQLRKEGTLAFQYIEEGKLISHTTANVPEDIDRTRVTFEKGDALKLRAGLGDFDVVLMANLLDRLKEPKSCLEKLHEIVRPGGQLIISTPCTWLEEYTPEANWLGGFLRHGNPVRTMDTLREVLLPNFKLSKVRNLPFLIREHVRKYQWSVAQASTWIRKEAADSE